MARKPILMPFGKHHSKVPRGYLRWLLRQNADLSPALHQAMVYAVGKIYDLMPEPPKTIEEQVEEMVSQ